MSIRVNARVLAGVPTCCEYLGVSDFKTEGFHSILHSKSPMNEISGSNIYLDVWVVFTMG